MAPAGSGGFYEVFAGGGGVQLFWKIKKYIKNMGPAVFQGRARMITN